MPKLDSNFILSLNSIEFKDCYDKLDPTNKYTVHYCVLSNYEFFDTNKIKYGNFNFISVKFRTNLFFPNFCVLRVS